MSAPTNSYSTLVVASLSSNLARQKCPPFWLTKRTSFKESHSSCPPAAHGMFSWANRAACLLVLHSVAYAWLHSLSPSERASFVLFSTLAAHISHCHSTCQYISPLNSPQIAKIQHLRDLYYPSPSGVLTVQPTQYQGFPFLSQCHPLDLFLISVLVPVHLYHLSSSCDFGYVT